MINPMPIPETAIPEATGRYWSKLYPSRTQTGGYEIPAPIPMKKKRKEIQFFRLTVNYTYLVLDALTQLNVPIKTTCMSGLVKFRGK